MDHIWSRPLQRETRKREAPATTLPSSSVQARLSNKSNKLRNAERERAVRRAMMARAALLVELAQIERNLS